jgi:hypothetical protein
MFNPEIAEFISLINPIEHLEKQIIRKFRDFNSNNYSGRLDCMDVKPGLAFYSC